MASVLGDKAAASTAEAIDALESVLDMVPIVNEATLHTNIMCPATGHFVSRSPEP